MWNRKELLFKTENYGSIPFAFSMGDDIYRIFFSQRNNKGQSYPVFIDSEIKNGEIKLIGDIYKIKLDLGRIGTFDDNGIMPSSVVRHNGLLYLYYIGWSPQSTVSYQLTIGLAISENDGLSFKKYSEGPILNRDIEEPFFNTAPYVIKDEDLWRMWYVSSTGWIKHKNKTEPLYRIRTAYSKDGIIWNRDKNICIDYNNSIGVESIGRPCVLKNKNNYEMYFSHRKSIDYRENENIENSYKIGMTKSTDGFIWEKNLNLDIIPYGKNEWDKNMREYCHVFIHKNFKYMIYNGNHFGRYGFGYLSQNNS
jgi:hypothetical protein